MGIEQRRHLRVKYPVNNRAGVQFDKTGKVVDISESGMKAIIPGSSLKVGQQILGTYAPLASKPLRFSGKVVRNVGDLVMIEFAKPMPRNILKTEVDHLIAAHGGFAEADEH